MSCLFPREGSTTDPLGQGHAFSTGGALVASFAQECMIRPIAAS